jgi:hypothetical protein
MKILGEGQLKSPVRAFAWSPTVDLCVFVMAKEVSAHRLTGEQVWSINERGLWSISERGLPSPELEFTNIAWRDDGTYSHISALMG